MGIQGADATAKSSETHEQLLTTKNYLKQNGNCVLVEKHWELLRNTFSPFQWLDWEWTHNKIQSKEM